MSRAVSFQERVRLDEVSLNLTVALTRSDRALGKISLTLKMTHSSQHVLERRRAK